MNIDDITFEQLTGNQLELAELIGIEAYRKLVEYYGGSSVYIKKFDTITKPARNDEICEKFNGHNVKALAKKYDLADKTIRGITAEKLKKIKGSPPDGQMKL